MREKLLKVQFVTVTRDMFPEYPSGQFSAIESSPLAKSQPEIVMSFEGPSKCSPSVLKPRLFSTQPETLTLPTFENRIWYAGVLTTTTSSILMLFRFIRLMPQYQTCP